MKRKMRRFAMGGPTDYASSGSAGGKQMSFAEAFKAARAVAKREGRDPDDETFTWRGKKYKAERKDSEDKGESKTASRKMSSEEFVEEYKKAPASGRMKQEAYYRANPEPSAESVSPEEVLIGPKLKAAAAGAGAAAAGYGLKKARDFLLRRGQETRSQASDVLSGAGAMSRSVAARDAEAAAYAERIKNARRSPGMSGYKGGGHVKKYAGGGAIKSSASRRADGCAVRGKTRGKIV
jgi:hypothetical protein